MTNGAPSPGPPGFGGTLKILPEAPKGRSRNEHRTRRPFTGRSGLLRQERVPRLGNG